jgi:hypothetical protein
MSPHELSPFGGLPLCPADRAPRRPRAPLPLLVGDEVGELRIDQARSSDFPAACRRTAVGVTDRAGDDVPSLLGRHVRCEERRLGAPADERRSVVGGERLRGRGTSARVGMRGSRRRRVELDECLLCARQAGDAVVELPTRAVGAAGKRGDAQRRNLGVGHAALEPRCGAHVTPHARRVALRDPVQVPLPPRPLFGLPCLPAREVTAADLGARVDCVGGLVVAVRWRSQERDLRCAVAGGIPLYRLAPWRWGAERPGPARAAVRRAQEEGTAGGDARQLSAHFTSVRRRPDPRRAGCRTKPRRRRRTAAGRALAGHPYTRGRKRQVQLRIVSFEVDPVGPAVSGSAGRCIHIGSGRVAPGIAHVAAARQVLPCHALRSSGRGIPGFGLATAAGTRCPNEASRHLAGASGLLTPALRFLRFAAAYAR